MNRDQKEELAKQLGASRVAEVDARHRGGPLDLLALREEFDRRLRSSGGRPTDPAWNVSRQVPFKDVNWERLKAIASDIGLSGPKVGPAQVAALLVESSLEDETEWREVLARSREADLVSQADAAELAGVTYNQMDDWVQRGWIVPARRKGRILSFSLDETVRGRWLRSIAEPATWHALAPQIRKQDLSQRFLVTIDLAEVDTARSRHALLGLLQRTGSLSVIDQLPERAAMVGPSVAREDGGVGRGHTVQRAAV